MFDLCVRAHMFDLCVWGGGGAAMLYGNPGINSFSLVNALNMSQSPMAESNDYPSPNL